MTMSIQQKEIESLVREGEDFDPLSERKSRWAQDVSDYHKRRFERELSPERDPSLTDEQLAELREKENRSGAELKVRSRDAEKEEGPKAEDGDGDKTPPRRKARKRRWDVGAEGEGQGAGDGEGDERQVKKMHQKAEDLAMVEAEGYVIPEETRVSKALIRESLVTEVPGVKDLQFFKEQDSKYFGKLLDNKDEKDLSVDELKERKIMRLLLRVKNGTPASRKVAMRQIMDNATTFGAKALFNQILPLLLEKSLSDQERHLLVKVVDRVLYRLDDMIRPYTHKILVVISPLLIDQDYLTRKEGREIISNLAKAAGLQHMILTIRPDIDHDDEYVRNTTSRALAVVASSLGIPALLPFLNAVCHSKKSWQARHTGIKTIQQIAILVRCGVLPHLNGLVDCLINGLTDEQLSVRIITAQALSALAESSAPYGIESFEDTLEPIWNGIRRHRGKGLAAFLRCLGNMIPLMDSDYASYYTRELTRILVREFSSPDDEMKKTVLDVIRQCVATNGVEIKLLQTNLVPAFFQNFWVRRIALDRRISKSVVETSVVLAGRVGTQEIISRLLTTLKDESEPFRKMAVETIHQAVVNLGSTGLTERTEERLIDGMLVAFQEQTTMDGAILHGVAATISSMDARVKPFVGAIVTIILHRLKNKTPEVRQQAADLISLIAPTLKSCDEIEILGKLSTVLYESLGEVYPEVLGSLLGALKAIATVVGINDIKPPANQILPTVTPILRNRHEKVQENSIGLVGLIADKGAEFVSPKEWMRICFELIDMLKSPKKSIRKTTNKTFGYIANAIGPQDVLVTLLNNLRVQERQLRVCTAVAIGIVAETCSPFTVLPALMNEYRTPEIHVQNGVLKAMAFMFEYIGVMSADYIYAVTPLLEDALTDRDQVHRQTAATAVRQIAIDCVGLGYDDAFIHLLNILLPNIYETSPHVIARILEGIEGIRNSVGPGVLLNYVWNGLFHPAKKVRKPFWKVYNSAYVQQLDSIVPYYPQLDDEKYRLDLFDAVI